MSRHISFFHMGTKAEEDGAVTFVDNTGIYLGNGTTSELVANKTIVTPKFTSGTNLGTIVSGEDTANIYLPPQIYEYETNVKYSGSDLTLDHTTEFLLFDRDYNGETLDLLQVELSGYIVCDGYDSNPNNSMVNYFTFDITREVQGISDGSGIYVFKGGRMPCQSSTTDFQSVLADYAFKFSIERDGNKFYACGEKLRTWISDPFTTNGELTSTGITKLYLSGMRNFKCRTLLAKNVPMIGPLKG